jgi:hypothetical protein
VSVKDRWVGPCEQVLNVPIVCRWYGFGKPSSRPSTEGWLCLYCFIDWLRRETGYGPMDQSAGVLMIVSGALFLDSSGPTQLCWWLRERLLYVDHMRYVWSGTICGPSVGYMWCAGRVFPCMVYINSNHRDYRIWVSLICGSHHVDNLTNLLSLIVTIDVLLYYT